MRNTLRMTLCNGHYFSSSMCIIIGWWRCGSKIYYSFVSFCLSQRIRFFYHHIWIIRFCIRISVLNEAKIFDNSSFKPNWYTPWTLMHTYTHIINIIPYVQISLYRPFEDSCQYFICQVSSILLKSTNGWPLKLIIREWENRRQVNVCVSVP